jgi:predicted nucleotide-binding protein (sugar kinase/HSP70/actin superfamily)
MGEGWLIPSEMLAYIEHGVPNIVCCQPFGCLPNHIVAKGMMHPLMRLAS